MNSKAWERERVENERVSRGLGVQRGFGVSVVGPVTSLPQKQGTNTMGVPFEQGYHSKVNSERRVGF